MASVAIGRCDRFEASADLVGPCLQAFGLGCLTHGAPRFDSEAAHTRGIAWASSLGVLRATGAAYLHKRRHARRGIVPKRGGVIACVLALDGVVGDVEHDVGSRDRCGCCGVGAGAVGAGFDGES